jgi:hypothetical protein
MLLMAVLNGVLGTICGFWFRAPILGLLMAVAFTEEVVVLKHTPTWSSALWSAILLISTLEVGYMIGSLKDALRLALPRGRVLRDLMSHNHGRLSHDL